MKPLGQKLKYFNDYNYSKKSNLKHYTNRYTRRLGKYLIREQLDDLRPSEADYDINS